MITRQEVIDSNIDLHTKLSPVYKGTEPHYRPENITKIDSVMQHLVKRSGSESLLDVGCGAGFIIDIAKKYFKKVRGIDITPEMIGQVETSHPSCDIRVQIAEIEQLPFEDNHFDMVTAYAVLHHLYDLGQAFGEAFRVLKPGGIFYSDLDPNFYFWDAIKSLPDARKCADFIERERYAVEHKDQELEEEFGVEKKTLITSEHLKHVSGGFKEEDIVRQLRETSFTEVAVIYEWFLGEGMMIHDTSLQQYTDATRDYLHSCLPLTRHMFKYIRIVAIK